MSLLNRLVGAAVITGVGVAYYVHQRKVRSGASYLDVIKQLPGEVQRVSTEARRRASEAVEQGKAAARRRDAELARQLESAGSAPAAQAPGAMAAWPAAAPSPVPAATPPAPPGDAEPGPVTA
jgi:hypothetical protein